MDGIYSASSYHEKGVNVALADGPVRFISQTIDAGNASVAPVTPEQLGDEPVNSPFGVWGALGTAGGSDTAKYE